jgi:uncharacterized repeat protein (TIGR03943 family)
VSEEAGGLVSLLVGAVALRLAVTGDHRRYVKPSMGPWLFVAGLVLVVIGGLTWWHASRRPSHDGEAGHEHRPGVAWLLVLPVVTLLLVAPPALGSFGVDRTARIDVTRGSLFEPLPAGTTPRPMSVIEFAQRAYANNGASMEGATIELTGFVAGTDGGEGFRLARYGIACCAADAQAVVVRVVPTGGGGPPPARDEWLRVTGTFRPVPPGEELPVLVADEVVAVDEPSNPYE